MTEGKQLTRTEYITPKTEKEIVAKALKVEQTLTLREQTQQELTDKLIRLVFQGKKNFSEISNDLGISRTTAYKYWNDWKRTEEAQQVDWEWWSLYRRLKRVNPSKALECLTRIKYRLTTEKVELKEEITHIKIVASWNNKYNAPQATDTPPTQGNSNSTPTPQDSES